MNVKFLHIYKLSLVYYEIVTPHIMKLYLHCLILPQKKRKEKLVYWKKKIRVCCERTWLLVFNERSGTPPGISETTTRSLPTWQSQ